MFLINYSFRCEACIGKWPIFAQLPKTPPSFNEMMKKAGMNMKNPKIYGKFKHFLAYNSPTDLELLPKMKNLLEQMHKKGERMNQLYFGLQECIKNYYRTQGNCLFFNDAKDILRGAKKCSTYDK